MKSDLKNRNVKYLVNKIKNVIGNGEEIHISMSSKKM